MLRQPNLFPCRFRFKHMFLHISGRYFSEFTISLLYVMSVIMMEQFHKGLEMQVSYYINNWGNWLHINSSFVCKLVQIKFKDYT